MMLGSAYGAVLGSSLTDSPALGVLVGVGVGLLLATIQAELSHRLTVNQFVVGIAVNILALGLTGYLLETYQIFPKSIGEFRVPVLRDLPLVGKALFAQSPLFYLLYLLIPATFWMLWRSRWGLEVRACGENPAAANVTGIPVNRRRRQAIYLCGLCAGYGGAYLSIGVVGQFSPNMTAGRGFIAIAAVIFGGWTLGGTILGCVLFGGADALRLSLPALGYELNPQLLIAAPYLLALLAMVFFAKRNRRPAALGLTYVAGAP
jgi:simple sugar transport system permease protein